jgi:DNA invertase Pin-like site-specific DNA recombinase
MTTRTQSRREAARAKRKPTAEQSAGQFEVTDSSVLEAGRRATRLICDLRSYQAKRAGVYVRISDDPFGLERGVSRQSADARAKADLMGWIVGKVYCENDTSAYRKKKITLPDGTVVWRVVRPEFRQMLDDLFTGVIDGIIVYDQDRLLRQPRDLEDLIDVVEAVQRPVVGITGSIDLLTSDGRAMARVMAAMALKSSEDTARRVKRAKLQDALDGLAWTGRRFGLDEQGNVIEAEKKAANDAAAIVLEAKTWFSATKWLERDSGVKPVNGGHWYDNTLRNMLLNPATAGISVYRGALREQDAERDPKSFALTDAHGTYVPNGLPAIIPVATWEALCAMVKNATEGKKPGIARAKKYLLSGLLRCANHRADGTVCGRRLVGVSVKRPTKSNPEKHVVVYKCPGISGGGCAGVSRVAACVDAFIEEVFFTYLATKAPKKTTPAQSAEPAELTAAHKRLTVLQERLADLRRRYAEGDEKLSAETYWSTLPELEASVKKAQAKLTEVRKGIPPVLSATDVATEWQDADTAGKRAILGRYLEAIELHPTGSTGKAPFDEKAVRPVWKTTKTPTDSTALAA